MHVCSKALRSLTLHESLTDGIQTETPEQLAKRNAELKGTGQKQAGVVRREKVAVLSRGTLIDAEMVQSRPDASYIIAGAWGRVA